MFLITGPRQSGKSTLLQHCLKKYNYVTLDDPLVRNLAISDPALFLSTYETPVIFDEIQYAPALFSYIKIQVDQNRRSYGQYVLTGSQVFSLMNGVSESLAGRVAIFQLYPLSWSELVQKDVYNEKIVIEQMLKGFYPEFQVQPNLNPTYWYGAYLSTYLEKDIRLIRNIQNLAQFQKYLILLAARVGQLFNLSEISKECGISQTTAKDWLMLLQSTSIIYLLEPYFRNITKRVVKSPKLFFVDTGLVCYLLRITSLTQLIHSPFGGAIFENMVVMEKVKRITQKAKRPNCYFYRTSSGVEVDLIVDFGDYLNVYEIKFTSSPKNKMAEAIIAFSEEHLVKSANLLSLYRNSLPLNKKVIAKHWNSI